MVKKNAKPRNLAIGDKVRLLDVERLRLHNYKVGDIVEIVGFEYGFPLVDSLIPVGKPYALVTNYYEIVRD